MARQNNNPLLTGASGNIAKQLVFKQYGSKTVVTAYPDMRGIKPSKKQKLQREKFQKAVAHAKAVLKHPAKKAALAAKLPPGASVYQAAIKAFMAGT